MTKLESYMSLRQITVEEFSEKTGVDAFTLVDYFGGRVDLTKTEIDTILKATGMEYEKLFKEW